MIVRKEYVMFRQNQCEQQDVSQKERNNNHVFYEGRDTINKESLIWQKNQKRRNKEICNYGGLFYIFPLKIQ